ncbi:MAG: hypothetical protein HYX94_03305 [Chloroflexi bacterium]|nr:hypothetical protein [Chloroflexota bacterium]
MAETVYLAPGDEIASIKAKVDRAKGNPVVVIAPRSVKALRNPLALRLLKRHGEFLGKDILLVASSRLVRQLARYHGLPTYSSLTQVRRWKPKRKRQVHSATALTPFEKQRSRIGLTGVVVSFFVLGIIALPFVVGYLVMPSATITLIAATKPVSETVAIVASTDVKAIDPEARTIPGRVVEALVEMADQIDIAGKKPVPDAVATGQVTFMNKVGAKATIPKGALLATKSGVRFRTGDEAALPAAQWSSVRVGIIADQAGKAGNVERLAIEQVIDPQLAAQVAVVNENPTQGGTDKEVGAVTTQDRDRLEAQALAKAKDEALQKLMTTKHPTESIYRETINTQLVDKQFDRAVGDEAKTVAVKLVVKATGLAFEAKDLNEVMAKQVAKKLPSGMAVSADGLKVKPLGADKWSDKMVSFYAQADALAITDLNEDQIKAQIAGKSREEAERYIAENVALAGLPDVKIEPGWTKDLPRFGWRTKINLRVP